MAKLMPIDDVVDCRYRGQHHCKKDGRAYQISCEHWMNDFPAECPLSNEPTAEGSGAPAVQSGNSRYTSALERIIRWALGEIWSFRPRQEGDGLYYWRIELRKRLNAAKARHCV